MTALLEIENLRQNYGGAFEALRGVSITVERGEFVALLGPNGSGKSSLVRHLNGLLRPTEGSVRIDGRDTRRSTVAQIARTVGFLFQDPDQQIFSYSVWEETTFGLKNLGVPANEVEDRATRALQAVELYERREWHPRTLSRGQRQRLAIASVLAMATDVLVLDEPTTGQDFLSRQQIMHLTRKLNEDGRTIIMITHDMNLVAEHAHRMVIMREGQIAFDGQPSDGFRQGDLLRRCHLRPPEWYTLADGLREHGVMPAMTQDGVYMSILTAYQRHTQSGTGTRKEAS